MQPSETLERCPPEGHAGPDQPSKASRSPVGSIGFNERFGHFLLELEEKASMFNGLQKTSDNYLLGFILAPRVI